MIIIAHLDVASGRNHPESVTEELLSCGICQTGFKQPKILQCGHVFCLRCLEHVWGTGNV